MQIRPFPLIPRSALSCALACCLAATLPGVALAQATAATVRGQVLVDAAPTGGATVSATNIATGLIRSVQSADNGSYNLAGLPPGTYRIDVNANGRSSSQTVTLQVGQTVTMNLGADAAPVTDATTLETIRVTAPVMVETKTSEVASYVTTRQIEQLPQNTRNFLAFADTIPGVAFSQDAQGNTRLNAGAQGANAINVFIDGVGQKNYVLTGGISGQDTSRGNPFPQSAIGEYKVITQNYKAEFDQVGSAAVVAATRSGTNEFTGNAFFDFTNTGMRARTVFEERTGQPKQESKEKQYGVSLSGPIVADAAHFFLAYEAKELESPVDLSLGRGYTLGQLPGEFISEFGTGRFVRPFKEDLYFGKINWSLDDAHYFEFTAKHRAETELIQIGGQRMPSSATDNINDETRLDLRHQYTAGDWLNDAHLTYEKSNWTPRPDIFAPGYTLSDGNWWDSIAQRGGSDNYQDKGQKGYSLQDDLTFTGWEGHNIKIGAKYKIVTLSTLEQNRYNPQFYYDIRESLTVPTHVMFGAPVAGLGDGTVSSRNKQLGLYIQDDWSVNDNLTLNLGVRWDMESTPSHEDFVTPSDVLAALQASNTNHPNSGININDYISTGQNRSADKNNFAPRLGFSWDFDADQRHVLFGGIGRSYDRNLFDYLQNEVSKGSWGTYSFDFNTPLHPCSGPNCLTWNPAYLDAETLRALAVSGVGGREVYLNHNDLVVPYSDQASLGFRNILNLAGHDWTTEITLSHIQSHEGLAFMLGNRRNDGSFFPPGASDPPPWGQGFAPFSNLILAKNALETKSNALMLRVEKPYTRASGWNLTAAYTYTDAEQNSPINGWPGAFNAARIEDYGWYPSIVSKHRLVVSGIYDAPWGITLSAKLITASGMPRYIQDCNEASWSLCHFTSYTPNEDFKQFDVSAQKEWVLGEKFKMRMRMDLLNVFNWANYNGFVDWLGGANEPKNPSFGMPTSQGLPTRMLKMTVGLSW